MAGMTIKSAIKKKLLRESITGIIDQTMAPSQFMTEFKHKKEVHADFRRLYINQSISHENLREIIFFFER